MFEMHPKAGRNTQQMLARPTALGYVALHNEPWNAFDAQRKLMLKKQSRVLKKD